MEDPSLDKDELCAGLRGRPRRRSEVDIESSASRSCSSALERVRVCARVGLDDAGADAPISVRTKEEALELISTPLL